MRWVGDVGRLPPSSRAHRDCKNFSTLFETSALSTNSHPCTFPEKVSRRRHLKTVPLTLADRPTIPVELIARRIYSIRGQKVMLDSDLAGLYQVPAKALNQAVKRNPDWFPGDFMFQLNEVETGALRSQTVTLDGIGRHRKYRPYAFTEHGVAMLSSVLRSNRAVQMNILINSDCTGVRSNS